MDFEKYISEHSQTEDSVLKELFRETNLKILMPRMLSGPIQGKLLEFFSKMICPKNILEIGTYTGYSAICMAKGLAEDGILDSIEINDELEPIIRRYFAKAGVQEKIRLHFGDALEIVPHLNKMYSLVFIDADKRKYIEYYQSVFDKVLPGGFIIADNVLWNGKVLEYPMPIDEYTKGIDNFNKLVQNDTRVENLLLPLRDGLMIIRKK